MFSLRTAARNNTNQLQQIRFRHSALNPQQEKIVNQLSVLSAGRKQPRLLKLCNEDYIKHRTVMRAWALVRSNKKKRMQETLSKQYQSMEEAAEELQKMSPQLYEIANQLQYGKRFPIELRVPTQYPPRQIWFYEYFPKN